LCCICRTPFNVPATTKSCSHTFCWECICSAIAVLPQCPIDRSPLSLEDVSLASPIVRHMVSELPVYCTHRSLGCDHQCERQLLEHHLKDECLYEPLPCPERKCDQFIKRKDLKSHSHPGDDQFCTTCDLKFPDASHASGCPDAQVSCEHQPHGCRWTGRQADRPDHLERCPYEPLKEFFLMNSKRISALEAENQRLKDRLEELAFVFDRSRHDVHAMKYLLHPWFKLPANASHNAAVSSSTSSPTGTMPLNGADFFPHSSSQSDEHDPFPEIFEGETQHTLFPPHRIPFQYPHLLPPDHTAPPTSISVAPLDLDGTLEHTFTSLRDSVVTLAKTVEHTGRRHDIALTTENVRVAEELAGVKAAVRGIRQQVHRIMMERVPGNEIGDKRIDPDMIVSGNPYLRSVLGSYPALTKSMPTTSVTKL
ncbi:hypothetical protein SISNIDRAFT_410559, partial [Sistotremastrum niveocremeum HHB9708]